eukprot:CFRG1788T1
MIFAYILSWISTMVLLICATLCIASGLFYLAEIVEEYPQPTKQFISIAMVVACILNACMWVFEGLPLFTVVLPGLVAHAVYSLHLPPFPVCNFTSVAFVGSISLARCVRFGRHIPRSIILIRHCSYLVMFVIHQYCVFAHFSTHYYVFGDVLAYFTVCVWLVPFIFFVSLTSGDSNLPTTSSNGIGTENYAGDNITAPRRNNKMGLKTILTWFQRKEGLPSVIENTPHGHDVARMTRSEEGITDAVEKGLSVSVHCTTEYIVDSLA